MTKPIKSILLVINPVSGGRDKEEVVLKISSFLDENKISYSIFKTTGKNDKERIRLEVDKQKPGALIAVGGDGTVNLAARSILEKDIPLGIIPFGSANGIATELNIPTQPDHALNIITRGKTRKIDVLKINNKLSLHLSDFGLNANVIYRFEQDHKRGFMAYARHYIQEMFSIKGTTYLIRLNGEEKKVKASMLLIANASRYGTGVNINPQGKLDDGHFELIVIRSYKTKELIRKVIAFLKGKINHFELIERMQTSRAIIKNPARKRLQIDGELAGKPKVVEVEILKKKLEVYT
ncbi:MAG: diacylglycerol kinase family lipid kinase [Bacteroidales bacterium]|nr:diacylglycerol kinase family lipid kinase [Bacteroidales bacterium]MCF8344131.1 diacylglycerol kinase family lipid kinase [Bacteroidales bacterium]MCF8350072.1 diacylglycerol kinase family lipid kinase [Bacteroidales bacterium]MCF8374984.1 diacylglycerol kinase family lipid kinase [Bacteroidales bacterium]